MVTVSCVWVIWSDQIAWGAAATEPNGGSPVRIGDQVLFSIHSTLADVPPADRARMVEERIKKLVDAPASTVPAVTVEDGEGSSYIVSPEEVLFVVTDVEAKAVGLPRRDLAEHYAQDIREGVAIARQAVALPSLPPPVGTRAILWAIFATVLVLGLATALSVVFPKIFDLLESWRGTRLRGVWIAGVELLSASQLTDALLLLSRFIRLCLILGALYLYMHFMLGLFPWTYDLESRLLRALSTPLEKMQGLRAGLAAFFIGVMFTLIATAVFVGALKLLQQLFPRFLGWLSNWGRTTLPTLKIQRVELLSAEQVTEGLLGVLQVARLVALAFLVYFYASSVLGFFPWTRQLSVELFGYILTPVRMIGGVFADSVPNIIAIVVIVFVVRYILKLIHLFFRGIERGAIRFAGFPQDWAQPTYGIVRFLVIVFAAIACFPYIPGSQSEGFRGISVFLGLLISLGSAAAIGNIIAGVVLTYMRPFQLGDRVKIADTVGDITEKTLLVTRIRTIKNVDITIPNSLILSAHIVNYSSTSLNTPPLILNTSVTIGYDAPWRRVHELLKEAAAATRNVLTDPEPFVLQTALNDFYVSYELNAYTGAPNQMAVTYSDLHQNVQDRFNEAGIEIMSPHYAQIRDGNHTTIPQDYLPKDYHAPAIRIESLRTVARPANDPTISQGET
ncbi:hypothetical protein YTPLAS18_04500 [Nitrospira sp.]|nr:hypothetical protein YTPLAS18_04500 [Nitrospira sp.]